MDATGSQLSSGDYEEQWPSSAAYRPLKFSVKIDNCKRRSCSIIVTNCIITGLMFIPHGHCHFDHTYAFFFHPILPSMHRL
ncbi:hypothetical protein HN011_006615 [Eciton burchellii]|nr:hypothetical protein HN011_006615 [Eciton burchellii]